MRNRTNIIRYILVIFVGLIVAFPFIWMVFSAFKPESELFGDLTFLPQKITFENFIAAWQSAPWVRFFTNSVVIAVISMLGQIVTCTMAGYALSVIEFRGQTIIFIIVLAASMIPFESTLIPSYLLLANWNLLDTYTGIFLPSLTGVMGIFIMRQNFMSIPRELFEASIMDDASEWTMFTKIAIPLSKTSIATVALFAFLNSWNSYIWPLLVTNSTQMRTVQVGLSYLIDTDQGTNWGQLMASASFIIIPILILFIFLQKYFVSGLMRSGIK